MGALNGREEPASMQELERFSLILRRIEATDKLCRERERAAEKAKAEKAKPGGQAKRQGGLSPETVAVIREAVEGRPPAPARTVTSVSVDPWNPAESPAIPVNPGESHLIPVNPGESQSIRDSHYASWMEIAPRVYRTSSTSILSLGPG